MPSHTLNKAISAIALTAVAVTSSAQTPAPGAPAQNAYSVAVVGDPDEPKQWVNALVYERLRSKASALLHSEIAGPYVLKNRTPDVAMETCRKNRAIALLFVLPSLLDLQFSDVSSNGQMTARPPRTLGFLHLYLMGCDGNIWLAANVNNMPPKGTNLGDVGTGHSSTGGSEARAVAAELADKAFEALSADAASKQDALQNGLRYGYFLKNGEKSAFFRLKPDKDGAVIVRAAFRMGTAARAGLKDGERVLAVNGRSTAAMTISQLDELVASFSRATYEVTIQDPNGTTRILRFEPQDAAWYAAHPLAGQ